MTFDPRNTFRSAIHRRWLAPLALLAAGLTGLAVSAEEGARRASPFETAELAPLAGYLGNWEIEAKWADGSPLWSRNEFTVGLGGNFLVARTFVRDGDGEIYQRYLTYFGYDKESKKLVSHGFTNDGTITVVKPVEMAGEPGRASLTSEWSGGGPTVRQTVQLTSANHYSWKVWIDSGDGQWQKVMDGVWTRVDGPRPSP